jgi:flagellar FliL protein
VKSTPILKFIFLLSFSFALNAQEFYTYQLFNNEFQAVFPAKPVELTLPNKVQNINGKVYQYGDKVKGLNFISQSHPSPLQFTVGEYEESTKDFLDKTIINSLTSSGHTLISYSSKFDRKQEIYILIVKSSYYLEGIKRYVNTKHFLYKKRVYRWTVTHTDNKDKYIFDKYQAQCKILSSVHEENQNLTKTTQKQGQKQYTAKIKDLPLNVISSKGKVKLMGLSLTLVSQNPSIEKLANNNKAKMIDIIIHQISCRNSEDLLTPAGKMLLEEELISEFNTILKTKKSKNEIVEDIIFDKYLIFN